MRTWRNKISIATLAVAALASAGAARGSTLEAPGETQAKPDAKPGGQTDGKTGDKKTGKSDDATTDEHPLSPVLEQAIRGKEKEVTEARREGIRLLEDYLHDSARGNEQAEALYKL